jgi:electron transfer flavoprotein beta subunit
VNIGICMKKVPSSDSRIVIRGEGEAIDTSTFNKYEINPYDEFAIEEAVRLKDAGLADKIIAFTIDDSSAQSFLLQALAKGADEAVLISDEILNGSDCLAVAEVLAAAIRQADISLAFCGKQSIDGDNAQVPIMVAELLGWGQANVVTKFELEDNTYKAWSDIGGGNRGVISGELPVVITCDKGLNEPRFVKLKDRMKAKKKPLKTLSVSDLGVDESLVGSGASKVSEGNWSLPPQRAECQFLEGDTQTVVSELVRLLREEEKVL